MLRWLGILLVLAGPGVADEVVQPSKFRVNGDTLVFDTETGFDGSAGEIVVEDIDVFLGLLRDTEGIQVLELNSGGGSVYAAGEMARIAVDFGLDTIVAGECVSACVDLFLAGETRRMTLGSKIGFHQRAWSADAMEGYYERWQEEERWDTPFDFAASLYSETQTEIYHELTYFIERGVDPLFAIETKRIPTTGVWYPSRVELVEAGVLRD